MPILTPTSQVEEECLAYTRAMLNGVVRGTALRMRLPFRDVWNAVKTEAGWMTAASVDDIQEAGDLSKLLSCAINVARRVNGRSEEI